MAAKKTTSAKVSEKKAVAKEAATAAREQTKEAMKKAADAAVEVVKESAEKAKASAKETAKAAKETAKKTAEVVKEATAETKKKATRKPTRNIVLQYAGKEINEADLTEKAIAQFAEENTVAARKIDLYIKPEENCAYYVINGQYTGRVEF